MSKNDRDLYFSISHVNLIFGCLKFKTTSYKHGFQTLAEQKCHGRKVHKKLEHMQLDILLATFFHGGIKNALSNAGPRGDPVATPSNCLQ